MDGVRAGLLVQLGIFGGAFVGFGIIAEWRSGVIDRELVTPASRTALITGRVLRDVLVLIVQAIILIACALFFGLRVPVGAAVLGIIMIGLLGAAFFVFQLFGGLVDEERGRFRAAGQHGVAADSAAVRYPVADELAPQWLQLLSDVNPFKHIVNAVRGLFRGEIGTFEGRPWPGIGADPDRAGRLGGQAGVRTADEVRADMTALFALRGVIPAKAGTHSWRHSSEQNSFPLARE